MHERIRPAVVRVRTVDPTLGLDEDRDERAVERRQPPANGGAVYGLGLIGALVWFWGQADNNPRDRGLAVLKAIVWPAFLVYEAFRALQR
jgi:hypothetical protein